MHAMNRITYIWRSIVYYRKQHLALFLGIMLSATVLTGALIIGDSIRFSLNHLMQVKQGKIRYAVTCGSRFMDASLASKLGSQLQIPMSPLLMLRGVVIFPDSGTRIPHAQVVGIDASFNALSPEPIPVPGADETVVGSSLAERLHVKTGDVLVVRVESASLVPVNAPFAQEPPAATAFRVKIIAIAGDNQMGRFSLGNNQSATYNVYLSRTWLAERMDVKGLVNTLVAGDGKAPVSPADLQNTIQKQWSLTDMGLMLKDNPDVGSFDLVSNRVFIDTVVERAVRNTGIPCQKVVSYFVNDIACKGRHTPYSFAAAVSSEISGHSLKADEAMINRWTADDLGAVAGDTITLRYYEIGPLRTLRETSRRFVVRGVMPNLTDAVNNSLMPDFQGMSEAGSCSEWDAGVPVDLQRIRDKDEDYWDQYRGTPKVILSLEAGKQLWKNPFGTLTLIRFREDSATRSMLTHKLPAMLKPSNIGLQVVDIRNEGSRAVAHAVDFTELFLGMSSFVILTGMLLTLLIYSLHASRRAGETSLLTGLGFSGKQLIRLRLIETSFVILLGSAAGALLGILYNKALLAALNSVWNDIVRTDMLLLHVRRGSLLAGMGISTAIAVLSMYVLTSRHVRGNVASQVKADTGYQPVSDRKRKIGVRLGILSACIAVMLVIISISLNVTDNAVLYLSAASFMLAGGILITYYGMLKRPADLEGSTVPSILWLARANLRRNAARSLSVITLLALGTFTVVITGSYRKTFYGTEQNRQSGTGGYLLWTTFTSSVPIDLNTPAGQERLLSGNPEELSRVRFLQFESLAGDDASCLNLNQVNKPGVLAVHAAAFDTAGAFAFVKRTALVDAVHPWLSLNRAIDDSTYPAYVDQTVLQYSLQRSLGDTLVYQGENGKRFRLVLSGTLNNTIFQGYILVADTFFRAFFPSSGGTRVMLTDAPRDRQEALSELLTNSLADYGADITPTSLRLANFMTVTNTYLTVFMALSGLGFIIGAIGLGIVLLRNLHERRRELALLLAVGYRRTQLYRIVFLENFLLLLFGWSIGMLSALIGVLPSLISPAFDLQGGTIVMLTAGILVNGLLWIVLPLRAALRKPLIPVLRNE
jgi:putative ABC transport system permease protein